MHYIIPKEIDFSNFEIIRNQSLYKIKYNYDSKYNIIVFGIIININILRLSKVYNNYILEIDSKTRDTIIKYEEFLQNHIPNYLSLLDDRFIKIKTNKIIDNYLNTNIKNINLHIKYVQRSGFFNIPVINIIPNEGISPFENDSKSLSIKKKSEK